MWWCMEVGVVVHGGGGMWWSMGDGCGGAWDVGGVVNGRWAWWCMVG